MTAIYVKESGCVEHYIWLIRLKWLHRDTDTQTQTHTHVHAYTRIEAQTLIRRHRNLQ